MYITFGWVVLITISYQETFSGDMFKIFQPNFLADPFPVKISDLSLQFFRFIYIYIYILI